MPYTKQIVCLANSYKYPSGRCIAGKETPAGGWIRPVSPRSTHEVALDECRYADSTLPRLLDMISVSLSEPDPQLHQTENHVMQAGQQWVKMGTLPFGELAALCDARQRCGSTVRARPWATTIASAKRKRQSSHIPSCF
jgi:hypothetical protein